MKAYERWRLPDGVEELLPAAARRLEFLRRQITDLHFSWGYELVNPPLIEYLESLLTGSGELLDLQTFKLVDQLNGKMMGVRADMTPQVARIDAHLLNTDELSRLFYMGTVLRTRPDAPGGSRSPLQLGAEIYGHQGAESDIEIIQLMISTVALAGCKERILLDLGHVGVYRGLVGLAGLDAGQETALFDSLQRKSQPEVTALLDSWNLEPSIRDMLAELTRLNGDASVIGAARKALGSASGAVNDALDDLERIVTAVQARVPNLALHIDLAELRGYSYHTGVVFAVFTDDHGHEIARGGRYDDIGAAFGRLRPATGFSTDLKLLARILKDQQEPVAVGGIFVDEESDSVWAEVDRQRAAGERVVVRLAGSRLSASEVNCDRRLVQLDGNWKVENI